MRRLTVVGLLLVCIAWPSAFGQSPSRQKPEDLAQTVSDAYKAKTLAELDQKHLGAGTITLVIEHSLMEGKNGNGLIKVRRFNNLAAIGETVGALQIRASIRIIEITGS